MTYAADPRVDAYIDALPDWQQAICREVRDLVHAADREVTETIKFTDRPYFVLQGNICALLAAKDHVNVFLYDGALIPRESSPPATTTRPPAPWPSARAKRSTHPLSPPCSSKSLPTTAPAAGAS
jgi:hypothetical protein